VVTQVSVAILATLELVATQELVVGADIAQIQVILALVAILEFLVGVAIVE